MSLWGEAGADVVQQGADDPVAIGAVVERPGGRLQAVLEAVDLVACEGLVGLTRQLLENPLPGLIEEGLLELMQREVVVARAVLHFSEGHLKVFGDPVAHGLRSLALVDETFVQVGFNRMQDQNDRVQVVPGASA